MNHPVYQGRVKFFIHENGFGFIRSPDGLNEDIFLHISELQDDYLPESGDLVEFAKKRVRKGTVAIQVKLLKKNDKSNRGAM